MTTMLIAMLAVTRQVRMGFVAELIAHHDRLIAFLVVWGAVAIVALAIIAGPLLYRRAPRR